MKTSAQAVGLAILGLLLTHCGGQQAGNSDAAIQQAIEEHLASRSDLAVGKMVMEMTGVRVEGEQAEADVVFRTTSGPPAQMAFRYQLRKEGRRWKVERGSPSAADSPHPSASSPGPDGAGEPLPEGHPPITSPH